MEDHEQLRDSEDADVTEEQRADARNYVATNSGVLDDKRADFHRRKESLEKLEKQLADYQALLEEEDREATERLESARLAKVSDSEQKMNLNLTWSHRWRRCDAESPRRRRCGRQRVHAPRERAAVAS